MQDWLEIFVAESLQDFFLNGSRQIKKFQLLMTACRFPSLSKTSCVKNWMSEFLADKLAILLLLRQQVMDEREERKRSGSVGHYAQPRTKLRRTFAALHQKYLACEQKYAEDQRTELNRREHTPSLDYQTKGGRLQDGILWDPAKRDLPQCPVCPHRCTMIVDNMQAIHAYNQGARDAVGGDGLFTAKSPKHGCFCYMVTCGGRPDGGNCPECIRLSKNGVTPLPLAGPGECGFSCGICSCRCQVVFEEAHRVEIAGAIKLMSNRKQKSGEGEAKKKPEEKGLAVVSRALADALENNIVREKQMPNRRLEVEIVQDPKTNCALDLLSNPHYAINLSLRWKLGKEVNLTRDVRVHRDGGRGGGATVKAAAAAGGRKESRAQLC